MSTHYEECSITHTSANIGCNIHYLPSAGAILKIMEMISALSGFVTSRAWPNGGPYGAAWVQFVTMSALVLTGLLFVFHVIGIINRLPGPWPLIELTFYALYSLMLLTAGIMGTARAIWSVTATVFGSCMVYMLHTFLCFREYQGVCSSKSSDATTTATTTTTTQQSNETSAQY